MNKMGWEKELQESLATLKPEAGSTAKSVQAEMTNHDCQSQQTSGHIYEGLSRLA